MMRFDYRRSAARDALPAFRRPALALGCGLLALAATWWLQTQRLATAAAELAALEQRAHAADASEARVRRVHAEVVRLRAIDARLIAARGAGLVAANAIVRVGNALPAQTWLTALGTAPDGSWTIGGTSARLDEIGAMLRRVQSLDRRGSPRLVSIAASGRGGRLLDFVIGWNRTP